MARAMAGLSSESLVRVSKLVGLEGTGEKFRTPLFYKAIMSVAPPLVRSISNVRYVGLDRIPSSGPAILAGNHTSTIDPIVKIMGARRPVHYLAKAEHFDDPKMSKLMTSTGQIETERDIGAAFWWSHGNLSRRHAIEAERSAVSGSRKDGCGEVGSTIPRCSGSANGDSWSTLGDSTG